MSNMHHPDIDDGQIRIISSNSSEKPHKKKRSRRLWWILGAVIVFLAVGIYALVAYTEQSVKEEITMVITEVSPVGVDTVSNDATAGINTKAYTVVSDTTLSGHKLTILTPVGGRPELILGSEALDDSTATLVVQAADIRRDNGKIVGAFVSKGNLISTGESKAGFCAIIGGNITVGVANATPYLEQALDAGGDFFRQYPLVIGGQIVENKPKGVSFRKALAELNGKVVVIISRDKMSFHDFSQTLVDLGVTSAIYLVGSSAYGFARTQEGKRVSFGTQNDRMPINISFLKWSD